MQTECPLPSGTDYGPVAGMVRGEIPRQPTNTTTDATSAARFSSAIRNTGHGSIFAAWILCALLFVLALAVAFFAREMSAL